MLYAKGELETGLYEFDIKSRSITKVEAIERADKTYFIVMIAAAGATKYIPTFSRIIPIP